MPGRRKLYTGEESAERGLFVLRLAAICNLMLSAFFVVFSAVVNPSAGNPYAAAGLFGVQLAIACAVIAVIRAVRTDLKTESLYNRYTYTLRAIGATLLAIIVTMCADLAALARFATVWNGSANGMLLIALAGALFALASGFSLYLILLAKRRDVCSKNPLVRPQIIPFLVLLILLGIYPLNWREGIAGGLFTPLAGIAFLFVSVTILSKAMFPCPDIPERDLVDDISGIFQLEAFDPRKHQWTLLAVVSIIAGTLLCIANGISSGAAAVYLLLESAGIFLGYALLRRFLGIVRS